MYVAPNDEPGKYAYGGHGTDLNGSSSSAPPELDDDGLANTDWLVTSGAGDHDAAQVCRDRGSDWYLPSKGELVTIWTNLVEGAPDVDGNNITDDFGFNISSDRYWSSHENNGGGSASQIAFGDGGTMYGRVKTYPYRVRCVRRD